MHTFHPTIKVKVQKKIFFHYEQKENKSAIYFLQTKQNSNSFIFDKAIQKN